MYINNFICPYEIKKDNKCGRIFRPWDSESEEKQSKDNSQDCTVSTTTQEDEDMFCLSDENIVKTEIICKTSEKEHIKERHGISLLAKTNESTHCPAKSKNSISTYYCTSPSRDGLGSQISQKRTKCVINKLPSSHIPSQHFQDPILYEKYDQNHLPLDNSVTTSPIPMDVLPDPYNPLYPELMQTNLAQHLGLPPNDPLLLESLAQGYALEEYARVLNQEQQAKLLAAKKQRPKKYKCPHCDVGFSNNGQLKGHIRIHTGERPFKCDDKECGKTFTRNEELTRHKRIHSGLRPFPCTHCGKRFGRKDHLKKHSRTHFQPRGLYAVPVVLPFEAWASGQANGYPFFPMMY